MGEIKSTLDLVMEKTKHLKMSQAEKKALDVEETLKKVPGLVQKYIEGAIKDRDLERELANYSEVDPDAVRTEFVKELARIMTFKDREKDLRVTNALKMLDLDDKSKVIGELENCLKNFHEEQRSLVKKKTINYLDELKKRKIRGSAVIPKVVLDQQDVDRLQALKAICLNLISRLV